MTDAITRNEAASETVTGTEVTFETGTGGNFDSGLDAGFRLGLGFRFGLRFRNTLGHGFRLVHGFRHRHGVDIVYSASSVVHLHLV